MHLPSFWSRPSGDTGIAHLASHPVGVLRDRAVLGDVHVDRTGSQTNGFDAPSWTALNLAAVLACAAAG